MYQKIYLFLIYNNRNKFILLLYKLLFVISEIFAENFLNFMIKFSNNIIQNFRIKNLKHYSQKLKKKSFKFIIEINK